MNNSRSPILDLARVVGMLFVMFIHSPVTAATKEQPVIFLVQSFLASGAVPLFFLLAGYLGARKINAPETTFTSYAQDKCRSLVLPFLFWNMLILLLVFAAKSFGAAALARGSGAYFDVQANPGSILAALLGIGRSPIVYQFWFLRDLIVVSFVAFLLCRYVPRIPLLAWLFFFVPVPMASSLAYFLLGYQLHALSLAPKKTGAALYCILWVLLGCGAYAGWIAIPQPLLPLGSAACLYFVAVIIGDSAWGQRLAAIGSSIFMVYALHEPLQTLLGKIWESSHLPGYDSLFSFLAIPAVVFPACVLAYYAVRRFAPALLLPMTGGR